MASTGLYIMRLANKIPFFSNCVYCAVLFYFGCDIINLENKLFSIYEGIPEQELGQSLYITIVFWIFIITQ